jgi:hypothetical protein
MGSRTTPLLRRAAVLLTVLVATVVAASSASAAPAPPPAAKVAALQQTIDTYIATYGGKQISTNEVGSDDGAVVTTFPMPGAPIALAPGELAAAPGQPNCPSAWSCLYQDIRFGGIRKAFYRCEFVNLRSIGFGDMTSSWHNNQTYGAISYVYDYHTLAWTSLWGESSPDANPWVGSGLNDRADGIQVC